VLINSNYDLLNSCIQRILYTRVERRSWYSEYISILLGVCTTTTTTLYPFKLKLGVPRSTPDIQYSGVGRFINRGVQSFATANSCMMRLVFYSEYQRGVDFTYAYGAQFRPLPSLVPL
jgi:hypothetical protein